MENNLTHKHAFLIEAAREFIQLSKSLYSEKAPDDQEFIALKAMKTLIGYTIEDLWWFFNEVAFSEQEGRRDG